VVMTQILAHIAHQHKIQTQSLDPKFDIGDATVEIPTQPLQFKTLNPKPFDIRGATVEIPTQPLQFKTLNPKPQTSQTR
jgi:hypothetical protein